MCCFGTLKNNSVMRLYVAIQTGPCLAHVMPSVRMYGICGAAVLSVAHVMPTGSRVFWWQGWRECFLRVWFVSPPLMFLSTSMTFSSCIVGTGSVVACGLAGGFANAFGAAHADMKGAGYLHPLGMPSIFRPGTHLWSVVSSKTCW